MPGSQGCRAHPSHASPSSRFSQAQIGDFGSARSAKPQGYARAPQAAPSRTDAVELQRAASQLHPADSYQQMTEAMTVGHDGGLWLQS